MRQEIIQASVTTGSTEDKKSRDLPPPLEEKEKRRHRWRSKSVYVHRRRGLSRKKKRGKDGDVGGGLGLGTRLVPEALAVEEGRTLKVAPIERGGTTDQAIKIPRKRKK